MISFTKELDQLIQLQQHVGDLNPALRALYPVAIVVEGCFQVYDVPRGGQAYIFVKDLPLPMPIPDGVRAAFQLEGYGGRIACVVTPEIFDSREGYITLLHEFVHCYQYETCEQELKMSLDIARQAQELGDCMWEIQHPFPYTAEDFIQPYTQFLAGLAVRDAVRVAESRRALRAYLGVHDFEYMAWQEWKEGFARWMENQVKRHVGLPMNSGGLAKPFSRVLFYAGGEALIDYLAAAEPGITEDLPALFLRMLAVPE